MDPLTRILVCLDTPVLGDPTETLCHVAFVLHQEWLPIGVSPPVPQVRGQMTQKGGALHELTDNTKANSCHTRHCAPHFLSM